MEFSGTPKVTTRSFASKYSAIRSDARRIYGISNDTFDKMVGQTVTIEFSDANGKVVGTEVIGLTKAGLSGAAHLLGAKKMAQVMAELFNQCFSVDANGNVTQSSSTATFPTSGFADGNGIPFSTYVKLLQGYDISSLISASGISDFNALVKDLVMYRKDMMINSIVAKKQEIVMCISSGTRSYRETARSILQGFNLPTASLDSVAGQVILTGENNTKYTNKADLIFGLETAIKRVNHKLQGGAGNDIVYGGKGNDTLIGGKDNDCLYGGAGDDTYVYSTGDGNDVIYDSDNKGKIVVNNQETGLSQVVRTVYKDGTNAYKSADGTITITHNSPWKVVLEDGGTITLGEDFESGDFGINLIDIPDTPTTTLTITGDLTPVDHDLSTPGIQTQVDDLGNIITDPSSPSPDREDTLYDSSGNDSIIAGGGNDQILAYRGGDDWLKGGSGDDGIISRNDSGAVSDKDILEGGSGADILFGGPDDDMVFAEDAGEMSDLITNGDTAQDVAGQGDFLNGGSGNDFLYGSDRNDILFGGTGSDLLAGGGGDDLIAGSATATAALFGWSYTIDSHVENDALIYDPVLTNVEYESLMPDDASGDEVHAGTGNDFVLTGSGSDVIYAGDGNDTVFGLGGNDFIEGGAGNDALSGDAIVSSLSLDRHGDDCIDGGDGNDTIFGYGGADQLFGGSGNDEIYGDSADIEVASQGNDYIDGREGDDYLSGMAGDDTILGGEGADTIYGCHGSDEIDGGAGNDVIAGDMSGIEGSLHGNDYIEAAEGDDLVLGYGGDDTIFGGDGNDTLSGDSDDTNISFHGNDYLDGGEGDDSLYGLDGNDELYGEGGIDQIQGGSGDDTIYGGDGADSLYGADGADMIYGEADADYLQGDDTNGNGSDYLDGGDGDDTIVGLGGNDQLYGQAGIDLVTGGSGDDIIYGGDGSDSLAGNEGSDCIYGEAGADYIEGDDALSSNDYLDGGDGSDTIAGGGGADTLYGGYGDDRLHGDAGNVAIADQGNDYIDGGAGVDLLNGYGGNDTLIGGDGNDTILGGMGDDSLAGGAGDDTYYYNAGDGIDIIDDVSSTSALNNVIFGEGITADSLSLSAGEGRLIITIGTSGTDQLQLLNFDPDNWLSSSAVGTFTFADGTTLTYKELLALKTMVSGTEGDDTITGDNLANNIVAEGGNDVLYGLGNSDILNGGTGSDSMYGGTGNDRYVVDDTADAVTELADEGIDSVESSVSYSLTDNVENLTLTGSAAIDGAGNDLNNSIIGNSWRNQLIGGAGNDTLSGGTGSDTLIGGTGNDTYVIEDYDEVIMEYADEGRDLVHSSISLSLADNVEDLVLTSQCSANGTGNSLDNYLSGNSAENTLTGLQGNDTLDGGAGNDLLDGGEGNDTYYWDWGYGSDTVTDQGGSDTVNTGTLYASDVEFVLSKSVNYGITRVKGIDIANTSTGETLTLKDWFDSEQKKIEAFELADTDLTGTQVENMALAAGLSGSEGDDYIYGLDTYGTAVNGLAGNDTVHGGSNNDTLNGLDGNDSLYGWAGDDSLAGGAGDDTLLGGTGSDTFTWGAGMGNDIIREQMGTDTVIFDGLNAADVEFAISHYQGDNGIFATIKATGETLRFQEWFRIDYWGSGEEYKVETFRFADGDLTASEVEALAVERGLITTDGDDSIYGPNDFPAKINGGGGNDFMSGGAMDDTIRGGAGDDFIHDYWGNNLIDGGPGNDTLEVCSSNNLITWSPGMGNDVIVRNINGEMEAGFNTLDLTMLTSSDVTFSAMPSGSPEGYHATIGIAMTVTGTGETLSFITDHARMSADRIIFSDKTVYGTDILETLGYVTPETGPDDRVEGSQDADGLYGDAGNDTLFGYGGDDSLYGESGDDLLYGGDGNDYLIGGFGHDTLSGGLGNDTYRGSEWHETSNDVIADGGGDDVLSMRFSSTMRYGDIVFSADGEDLLLTNRITGSTTSIKDWFCGDSHKIERFVYDYDYELTGAQVESLATVGWFVGGDGNDILYGPEEPATLYGGGGDDTIYGGNSSDTIYGGDGDDVIFGVSGVSGAGGSGRYYGGDGNDFLQVGSGVVNGGTGSDIYMYGAGSGRVSVDSRIIRTTLSPRLLMTAAGASGGSTEVDTLVFGEGIDKEDLTLVSGGESLIIKTGNEGDDVYLNGFDPGDVYTANAVDVFRFASGEEIAYAELLDLGINLYGTDGQDVLTGTGAPDRIHGSGGNDTLAGGRQNDVLTGGSGNDTYTFEYGDGADTVIDVSAPSEGNVIVFGDGITRDDLRTRLEGTALVLEYGSFGDSIRLENFDSGNTNGSRVAETIRFADGSEINILSLLDPGTEGNDTIVTGAADDAINARGGDDYVSTNAGNDTINGGTGNDTLMGGAGNDSLNGGAGNDAVDGGEGNDTYLYNTGDGTDAISDPSGTDTLVLGDGFNKGNIDYRLDGSTIRVRQVDPDGNVGAAGIDIAADTGAGPVIETLQFADGSTLDLTGIFDSGNIITGTDGFDFIMKGSGNDLVYAGAGVDMVFAGSGNDRIYGGSGLDSLYGQAGDDTIFGEDGLDLLLGGDGSDTLYGGSGADVLYGDTGNDVLLGGSGNDLVFGGAGNDYLRGGTDNDALFGNAGDDTYIFTLGAGTDSITDSGSDGTARDRVLFGPDVLQNTVALFQSGQNLIVGYGTNDTINVLNQASSASGIEKMELNDGLYLTDADIVTVIQQVTAFASANGIALSGVNDVRNNPDLMNIIASSWHA